MEVHPGLWLHNMTGAVMTVYVDDLILAAGKNNEARLWKKIEHHVKFGEPATPISKFLGGHHQVMIERGVSNLTTQMKGFMLDAAEKFRIESEAERLASVRAPYLDEVLVEFALRLIQTYGNELYSALGGWLKSTSFVCVAVSAV